MQGLTGKLGNTLQTKGKSRNVTSSTGWWCLCEIWNDEGDYINQSRQMTFSCCLNDSPSIKINSLLLWACLKRKKWGRNWSIRGCSTVVTSSSAGLETISESTAFLPVLCCKLKASDRSFSKSGQIFTALSVGLEFIEECRRTKEIPTIPENPH